MAEDRNKVMQDLTVRWTQAQPTVAAFISATIPNFHDSEDVLQRVAATIVTKFGDYDADKPFVAWALGVARVEVLRFRSQRGKQRLVFDDEVISHIADAYERVIPQVDKMREALHHCMAQLRGRAKQLLEMRYFHELQPARIATRLGMTSNAVFVALHRVRTSLRRCMGDRLKSEESAG